MGWVPAPDTVFQPTLLDIGAAPSVDPELTGARRRFLGAGAWVDWSPRWVQGADTLFEAVLARAPWAAHERSMYDAMVLEPRLTTGRWDDPPNPVPAMARLLSARYGLDLSVVSANLYRDGADSVAWHGDRVGRDRAHHRGRHRVARLPPAVPVAPGGRRPVGALRPGPRRPARPGRHLPAQLPALRAQAGECRGSHLGHVP
jgi:hypothetical protein